MRALILVLLFLGSAAAVPAAADRFARSSTDPRALLRRVERAQTEYRASHGRYTASPAALGIERPRGVDLRITAEGGAGYSAVAAANAEECVVFHGAADPPRPYARTPGRIACRAS
jgi:hypothetical protein